jgi:triosephosphate isomerase
MKRRPVIAGNWKMNKTVGETVELLRALKPLVAGQEKVEVVVAPPFTALYAAGQELKGSTIGLAGQNLHWEEKGAFTAEVSPGMLKEAGCGYVIIGHSERRQYFGETDETVNRRIKAALGHGLIPIFCVGETLAERESGRTFSVIERQLAGGLKDFDDAAVLKVIVAYEPVWAIGTGKTASPDQAQEVHRFIRTKLGERFAPETADQVRIQYGGSVTPENAKGLMSQADIDGALVGGASLKADSFAKIVRFDEM